MKFLNFNRVLCLSPHPDDVEYSMAGTIMKYSDTHFDILCLSQGGDCDITTGTLRKNEVVSAWKQSISTNYSLYFSECKFLKEKNIDEWVNWIEYNFTHKYDYDAIVTSSSDDSHFEHVFVQGLAAPLSRVKFYSLIEYKSPSSLENFHPNLFVSLENYFLYKKMMLNEFTSQLHRPYFKNNVLEAFHTNFQSLKKGLGFVEQFKIIQFNN